MRLPLFTKPIAHRVYTISFQCIAEAKLIQHIRFSRNSVCYTICVCVCVSVCVRTLSVTAKVYCVFNWMLYCICMYIFHTVQYTIVFSFRLLSIQHYTHYLNRLFGLLSFWAIFEYFAHIHRITFENLLTQIITVSNGIGTESYKEYFAHKIQK